MADLIDRKVLLREMEKLYNERAVDAYMTGNKEIRVSWNDAVYLVTVAPTVEAEPVKHGKWIYVKTIINGEKEYKCSECNAPLYCYGTPKQAHYEWCYSCGAKMDDEESDIDENWYSDEYRRIGEDEKDEVEE